MPDFIRVNLVSFILLGVAIVACVAAIIVSIVQKKNAKPTIDIIMPEKEEKKENDKKTAMIMPRAKSTETKPLEPKPVETKVEEPKTETVSADEEQEEESSSFFLAASRIIFSSSSRILKKSHLSPYKLNKSCVSWDIFSSSLELYILNL